MLLYDIFFVASNTRTLSVHKAIAICARKSTQDVLTLWNNIIGRQGNSLSVSSEIISLVSVKKAFERSAQSLEHEEHHEQRYDVVHTQ